MTTIKLKVSDKVLDKLLWLLNHFKKEEVEVISDSDDFEFIKKKVHADHQRMKSGQSKLYSLEEVDKYLDDLISKYEA